MSTEHKQTDIGDSKRTYTKMYLPNKHFHSSTLIMTSLLLCTTLAYPDGPPLSACGDMTPRTQMGELGLEGHTTAPQNWRPTSSRPAAPPYYIQIHPMPTHYEPDQQYNGRWVNAGGVLTRFFCPVRKG